MSGEFEGIAWIKQRLGAACVDVPVQGDQPLMLDDPSCSYVTLSEHHHLFCVGYEGGAPIGRREHVAGCHAGQLLFGLAPKESYDATALLLSGVSGSVVWRVPTALLFRLALETPEGQAIVEKLFDSWLSLLIGTLNLAPVPTRSLGVTGGQEVETDEKSPLHAEQGIVWVAPAKAPRLYAGMDLANAQVAAECWPLSEQGWVLPEPGHLRIWKSSDLLRANGDASFADGFYAFVISVVASRRAGLAASRLRRDLVSRQSERKFLSESLGQLAAVGRGQRLEIEYGGSEAFERACRTITGWLQVEEAPRVVRPKGPALSQMQAALSRLTGVRMRGVLLEHTWYKNDGGALLGFLLEGDDALYPVALLPGPGGYRVHDDRQKQPYRLTAALSNGLHPQAYQFYPPLPAKPLGPLDVLDFSSRRARRDIAFSLGVGLAMGSVATFIPLLTGQIFDRIIPGAERGLLRELTMVLIGVYGGLSLFDLAQGFCLVRAQTRMDATLEAAVWDRLLSLPLRFFRDYSAGDLAARAAGIGRIREMLAGATLSVLLSGLFSVWNFGLLFVIDPRLAFAATIFVSIAGCIAGIAAYAALKRQRIVAELDGKIGGLLLQLLGGIAKLRVTGAENRAFGVWSRLFAKRRDADLAAERVNIRVNVFQGSYPVVCSMVLFWMLANHDGQKLSTGQFLAFSASFTIFLSAVLDVIETTLSSLTVVPMYERAKPILTQAVESRGKSDVRIEIKGAIELSHVSFRYEPDGPLILDDVNVRIEPNQFVAVVGPSGSGKSTLLRVLLGFEQCSEGGVFYDGQALSQLDVRVVRQQVGVVLQNSRVMAGDILTNIVGNTGQGMEEAWRAAHQAAFGKDVEAMPMGMHTVISQGGGTLSGGQKQRLLIARALASGPRILFFDEATSALDNVTQAAVSSSLESLRVTRLVIAHRLSTIERADKIIVLERGRVVQMGRFDELMSVEGVFRQLALRQTV
jgi:ATP-binding cassette subfamily C protein